MGQFIATTVALCRTPDGWVLCEPQGNLIDLVFRARLLDQHMPIGLECVYVRLHSGLYCAGAFKPWARYFRWGNTVICKLLAQGNFRIRNILYVYFVCHLFALRLAVPRLLGCLPDYYV